MHSCFGTKRQLASPVRKIPPQLSSRASARLDTKRPQQITPVATRPLVIFIAVTPSTLCVQSVALQLACRARDVRALGAIDGNRQRTFRWRSHAGVRPIASRGAHAMAAFVP